MKNKFDQAIKKLQQLTEENNYLKENLINPSSPKNISSNFFDNTNNYYDNYDNKYENYNKNNFNENKINKPLKRHLSNYRQKHNYTLNEKNNIFNFDDEIEKDNTMNIFPCQKEQVKKESLIVEIESKLYKLQRERDKLNDELFKLPEFPKKKIEINQRRELELKIEQYNKNINDQKTKLRELNKVK